MIRRIRCAAWLLMPGAHRCGGPGACGWTPSRPMSRVLPVEAPRSLAQGTGDACPSCDLRGPVGRVLEAACAADEPLGVLYAQGTPGALFDQAVRVALAERNRVRSADAERERRRLEREHGRAGRRPPGRRRR